MVHMPLSDYVAVRDQIANGVSRIDTRVLAGRYRLLNPLAEGGMGTVWLAADEMLGRDVAVKEIRLPPDLDPVQRQEICAAALREAHLAARLQHPSIVTVHDVIIEQERPWLVMELLSGTSLEQTVRERRPLPVHQAARVGVGILSALVAAHAEGMVHRDVRPGNDLPHQDRPSRPHRLRPRRHRRRGHLREHRPAGRLAQLHRPRTAARRARRSRLRPVVARRDPLLRRRGHAAAPGGNPHRGDQPGAHRTGQTA